MRPLASYLRNLPRAPLFLAWFLKVLQLFERPGAFLRHYLAQTSPQEGVVALRDGTRVYLSGHPHDVITLFVVFVREDYGRFRPGGTVVDIGASLGAFALYAARLGAAKVLAYEANSASYRCLMRNIEANGLQGRIEARSLAVTGTAGATVRFPAAPSAYNRIAQESAPGEFESVATTSLAEILARDAPGGIDLLKLDCEGAEYEILGAASREDLMRVREIRMEYHNGKAGELRMLLQGAGFAITREHADSAANGTLWAARA